MSIPFEPTLFGTTITIHLVLEYLAFFIGFRYYIYLRRRTGDTITTTHRLLIIMGAVFGAFLGSRVMGFLEHPTIKEFTWEYGVHIFNRKTIMGGLFGGLMGVELMKKSIGEPRSSGDLFTFPIILGIIIGRIGCFLSGIHEFTYGIETQFFMGMDLGDGVLRHPIALYEILFLLWLWVLLYRYRHTIPIGEGLLFQYFMISYFSFRFVIEFLKPNTFLIFGLSSIQYLCILCLIYYRKTIIRMCIAILHSLKLKKV